MVVRVMPQYEIDYPLIKLYGLRTYGAGNFKGLASVLPATFEYAMWYGGSNILWGRNRGYLRYLGLRRL